MFMQQLAEAGHNSAMDSAFTRPTAQLWNALARPLVDHFYGPLAEKNHMAGVIAVNATLTAPRLLEVPLARTFVTELRNGNRLKAGLALAGKILLKLTDGLDGATARQSGTNSIFGTGLDPGTDMIGSASDDWAIQQVSDGNDSKSDRLTHWILRFGTFMDGMNALAGLVHGVATSYAEKQGFVFEESEKPKATAMAKARYTMKCIGNGAFYIEKLSRNEVVKKVSRTVGQGFNTSSDILSVYNILEYGSAAVSKIKRGRAAKRTAQEIN